MTKCRRRIVDHMMPDRPSPSPYRFVGHRLSRSDGPDKVCGTFNYLADEKGYHGYYGVLLTSPYAHARVVSIDLSRLKEQYPEVVVLTASDAPETKYNSGQWFWGQTDHPDETLLTDHVRHVGDRVALVLAFDELTARKARDLIDVKYELLEPVLSLDDARQYAQVFHDDQLVTFDYKGGYGDVDSAFGQAAHVFTSQVKTPKIHHAALETHAVVAYPRAEGVLEIHTPCQILYGVQQTIGKVVPLPLSKIRVIKSHMGGTFGGKQEVVYEALCAWAAWKLKQPVFINTNREETILGTRTRGASLGTVSTALDKDGHILARRFNIEFDAGAYVTGARKAVIAMSKKVSRLYRIPNLEFVAQVYRTTTTPSGACRGYGSPQIHAITEIHTDQLCQELGYDPVEFRLKNLVLPTDPDPSGACDLGQANILECLKLGLEKFDWYQRVKPTVQGRFRRGVGLACCTHGNGYYGTVYHDTVGMSLRMFEDGSVVLRTPMHEMGNGTIDAMATIVAEQMGLEPDQIVVTEGDSTLSNYDIGCQASRVIYVCGECARRCAQKAIEMLVEESSKLWKSDATYCDGVVTVGDRSIPVAQAVTEILSKTGVSIDVTVQYIPQSNPGSYGCHFADVTVDTLTGSVKVNDYLAVHDVGQSINRSFVEGQIYGGVQMGLGMGLLEELSYDEKGQPSARNFDKYHLYNTTEMPPVDVMLVEHGEPGGPFGAKSIGEIATVPVAPAVVNAVNRALGTSLNVTPLTPARIVAELIRQEEKQ